MTSHTVYAIFWLQGNIVTDIEQRAVHVYTEHPVHICTAFSMPFKIYSEGTRLIPPLYVQSIQGNGRYLHRVVRRRA